LAGEGSGAISSFGGGRGDARRGGDHCRQVFKAKLLLAAYDCSSPATLLVNWGRLVA